MLRALIVDDEPLARDELAFLLSQCEGVQLVGAASSAMEAQRICADEQPEIAFVDLRLPGLDGLSLAERLRSTQPTIDVVIVSAHRDGALRAFDVRVADYLLKPVRLERLRLTLSRFAGGHRRVPPSAPLERVATKRRGSYLVVSTDEIVYFEAKEQLLWAVTTTGRFAIDWTVATLTDRLDPDVFFQSHRSCIVRLDRIRRIEPAGTRRFCLLLDHPHHPRAPLARDRVSALRRKIPFTR